MKKYRYRKVTPKIKKIMKDLRKQKKPYEKIGRFLNISSSAVAYHLNPKIKKKTVKLAKEAYKRLSEEDKRRINKKRQKYKNAYLKERYHNDEGFRKKLISQIMAYQKRKQKEKIKNENNLKKA